MKKDKKSTEFEMPRADVIVFENEDVITASDKHENELPAFPLSFDDEA